MFSYFANPERFMRISGPVAVGAGAVTVVLLAWGLYLGLFVAPPEADQQEYVRMVFIHAPIAIISLMGYTALGVASFIYLVWRHSLADAAAKAIAPIGALYAALTLVTGSIYGRPTWGTWWEWDGRLASMLVLFLFFLGYIALRAAIDDERQSARAGGILALVGLVNVPIVKFSVDWWQTLHQPAGDGLLGTDSLAEPFRLPFVLSFFGFAFLFLTLALVRTRAAVFRKRAEALIRARERAA
jgi:heme exporter protein C